MVFFLGIFIYLLIFFCWILGATRLVSISLWHHWCISASVVQEMCLSHDRGVARLHKRNKPFNLKNKAK